MFPELPGMASECKRKAREHRVAMRSRFGCRNCKLRKIECDQGEPLCNKCTSFGVVCNFLLDVSDLQPIGVDTSWPAMVRGQRRADVQPPLTNAVWTCDTSGSYQLNAKCQDFITRYLGRSLITPSDPTVILVNSKLLELAFTHPYLMHASLAVAFTYDRYLNGHSNCRPTIEECFHWSQSTVLLKERLTKPIKTEDKDSIWGTAAALWVIF
ncbi:C6 finger domain protein [Colletotrichum graminicola]|nr:C6 finger domain protein [Colletotrichum graminicola]